ncbi:MAG: STAS domain-containing protein [Lachnospiraceae bacterium]|nr:STAS domain-containing protein [Lachnospiraceae bacterium]
MLEIKQTMNGDVLTVELDGRLDTTTARLLEDNLRDQLENARKVIFEVGRLKYISSAGLRVLLATQKAVEDPSDMVIRNITEEVREIFEVTGFMDILTVE